MHVCIARWAERTASRRTCVTARLGRKSTGKKRRLSHVSCVSCPDRLWQVRCKGCTCLEVCILRVDSSHPESGEMVIVRTIAVMNEKGGSGKTTTTINLAAVLAERGFAVWWSTSILKHRRACGWAAGGSLVSTARSPRSEISEPYVRQTAVAGIEIIAGSRELAAVDDLRGRIGIQTAVKRALAKLGERWDIVLIDCPPNLGLLAVNALAAADEVLVPVETHGIAAVGLSDLLRTIEDARESQVNPTLTIGAIVATRYNRTKEAKDCVQQTRQAFPDTDAARPWFVRAPDWARRLHMRARSSSTIPTAWARWTTARRQRTPGTLESVRRRRERPIDWRWGS